MSLETTESIYSNLAIDSETADKLFLEARTANTFSDEAVSDEALDTIYELTKMGPTMMNNQPLRITWVKSQEAREAVVAHMMEGNRAKSLAAPSLAVLSYDADWHEQFSEFFPHAPERKAMFDEDAVMRAEIAKNNAWMQAGYFIMAVRAAGLHAGPMGGFNPAGVDTVVNAGKAHHSFLIVNVGTPGENPWFDRLPRLDAGIATSSI
ncbi:malonic semialdehyde reductase [Paeniglutamicibacter kerguelensis]|uniref:3-hydroxypropanoate dehydrogenase n=1 Tax=Paeniglutamicibacter kerguelensis TaxID=254788 RepID=A0ABS4XJJ3_9MICC|nr:3-hydroxypropanoate dehydrogenase [Paeniglutamicibacter kerguelensis]